MLDILVLLVFNALLCLGVYIGSKFSASDEFDDDPSMFYGTEIRGKMLLWFIRYYGSYVGQFWSKPIYKCLPCMASLWSLPMYVGYVCLTGSDVFASVLVWPLYVLTLSGINYLIAANLVHE